VLRVTNCVCDRIRPIVPQPTKWKRIGNQIDAPMIFARVDFLNVHLAGWVNAMV
jgi:hypothetical protein